MFNTNGMLFHSGQFGIKLSIFINIKIYFECSNRASIVNNYLNLIKYRAITVKHGLNSLSPLTITLYPLVRKLLQTLFYIVNIAFGFPISWLSAIAA